MDLVRTFLSSEDWAILMMISALPLARPLPGQLLLDVALLKRVSELGAVGSKEVELRGGVPVGLWMGLAVPQVQHAPFCIQHPTHSVEVMLLCIVGNMIPIPLILTALRTAGWILPLFPCQAWCLHYYQVLQVATSIAKQA